MSLTLVKPAEEQPVEVDAIEQSVVTGYCRHCGLARFIVIHDEALSEIEMQGRANSAATSECDCYVAKKAREAIELQEQAERARNNAITRLEEFLTTQSGEAEFRPIASDLIQNIKTLYLLVYDRMIDGALIELFDSKISMKYKDLGVNVKRERKVVIEA
jgi:hypothetical protein